MRALLITVGSRGDAEPFCALADALGSSGHRADLFLARDVMHLAPPSATVHELPFTQLDFYKYVGNPSHGSDHPNPRVRFVGVVADVIAGLVLPQWEKTVEVARHADVIITSSLARPLAMAISQKLGIPICIVHLQPLLPTKLFPHYSHTDKCVEAIKAGDGAANEENLATYWELERFQYDFLQDRLEELYSSLGTTSPSVNDCLHVALTGRHCTTYIANAFSHRLIPPCPDAGPNVFDVGPLADHYTPRGWTPPAELVSFLEGCADPPVCVGYGSMPFEKACMVVEVLRKLSLKAVLVGDALKLAEIGGAGNDVLHVSSAPYAWLLPRCSMMMCHGGAGVVNAALRAGIPVVISPLMGDQFFWAELLEAKGLGAKAGNLNGVTEQDLSCGIQRAEACKEAAGELGRAIRSDSTGVNSLISALEAKLASARASGSGEQSDRAPHS